MSKRKKAAEESAEQQAKVTREILERLSAGESVEAILASRTDWTSEDVKRAATDALAAIAHPRVETRDERIARIRKEHPRAYQSWTEEEDARLLRRFDEGARVADLSKELQRPTNAIRERLERWLGPSWRGRGTGPSDEE